jgi:hypothetical protein
MSFQLKKKVRDGCALLGGDMQKPYTPKCGQGKTKIDLFRDFYKLFQLKFPHCIPISYLFLVYSKKGTKN